MRSAAVLLAISIAVACKAGDEAPRRPAPRTIRVAVIGGMVETGFWAELAERYQRLTGDTVELVASGPKPQVIAAFKRGGVDLIAVHACDAMVNLVADGLARDPQPFARNDLVIVGPAADPAGIRGSRDAVAALRKIVATRSKLLVHASHGADGVLHDLREEAQLALDPEATISLHGENPRAVLERAAAAGAYTIVGRIPFASGKLRAEGIELMVQGDPRLRRPYLVEVSTSAGDGARELAAYLRAPETQQWIATFGVGRYDGQPLFFPVAPATR